MEWYPGSDLFRLNFRFSSILLLGTLPCPPDIVSTVAVGSRGVLIDLDTPADYDAYRPDRVGR